ncbi:MAG: enoyl-CoA hydratase/isomerase family protein [Sorangiineae bacterium]|nr:enoyl-CoA hydratase/isomerase family protein [Polyangiaceae bacterium]MEB2322887.1 enoyl-CoA hydratase/isomerase family protein [Sorangiineae bacterium]
MLVTSSLHRDARVLDLLIDNPKGNILTGAVMRELDAALAEHASAKALRLVTIRGAGKNFSFGASVEEHQRDQAPAMLAGFHALIRRVAGYPVPVAAVVDGRCLGGAFELALACHFVFATDRAVFGCPEIKLGVLPPVLAAIGPHRLGASLAERLLITGEDLDVARAEEVGFVTRVLSSTDDPFAAALGWYDAALAGLSAYSLRQAVTAVRRSMASALGAELDAAERHYLESLLPSHDGNEGITAFLEKRAPVWTDD